MSSSVLEQYRIADLLEWHKNKQLLPNPDFQRRSVWTTTAKVFLIDTILRQLPMPKIYVRTKMDVATKKTYRELVDGQQRIKAIIEFAQDKIILTERAKEFAGLTYSTLQRQQQEDFLSYAVGVGQLINATDSEVLEIFARLNSYTVSVNSPELRHAIYQGPFRWSVYETAKKWDILWDTYHVVSVRERLRMGDDSLMAEMFGIILNGITDGGQPKINKLYIKFDKEFPQQNEVESKVNGTISYILDKFGEVIAHTPLSNAPHFLMLFAAVAHARYGIPTGEMESDMPDRNSTALRDTEIAIDNLNTLGLAISLDEALNSTKELDPFIKASTATTQRIKSRKIRFPVYYRALLPIRI